MTFLWVSSSRSSVKVKVSFQGHTHVKCKIFTLDITFEWYNMGSLYLICEFIVTRPFCSLQVQGHQSRSVFKVILMQNANFNNRLTFDRYDIGPSYLTSEFLVTRH